MDKQNEKEKGKQTSQGYDVGMNKEGILIINKREKQDAHSIDNDKTNDIDLKRVEHMAEKHVNRIKKILLKDGDSIDDNKTNSIGNRYSDEDLNRYNKAISHYSGEPRVIIDGYEDLILTSGSYHIISVNALEDLEKEGLKMDYAYSDDNKPFVVLKKEVVK